jgi:hypothetical protein
MKQTRYLASLLPILTSAIFCGAPALAQEFLNPVAPTAPTYSGNGALNSGGALGALSHSTNFVTAPGAFNAGLPNNMQNTIGNMQSAGNGLLAPNSVDMTPLPSGQWNYGFNTNPSSPPLNGSVYLGQSAYGPFNQQGNYASLVPGLIPGTFVPSGITLPVVSTSSNDLNTVDCPFLRETAGPLGISVSALNLTVSMPGVGNLGASVGTNGVINLQESAAGVGSIQESFGGFGN